MIKFKETIVGKIVALVWAFFGVLRALIPILVLAIKEAKKANRIKNFEEDEGFSGRI